MRYFLYFIGFILFYDYLYLINAYSSRLWYKTRICRNIYTLAHKNEQSLETHTVYSSEAIYTPVNSKIKKIIEIWRTNNESQNARSWSDRLQDWVKDKVIESIRRITPRRLNSTIGISNDIGSDNEAGVRWMYDGGHHLLLPTNGELRGIIHFLGGPLVGAAPQLAYKYLLESLSDRGYLIVATPYRLSLDYKSLSANISERFRSIEARLIEIYGPLPVIGLGHSTGAVLHTLISSQSSNKINHANVLLSFRDHQLSSIPLFEEFVVPLCEDTMSDTNLATSIRELMNATLEFIEASLDRIHIQTKWSIASTLKDIVDMTEQLLPIVASIAQGSHVTVPSPEETQELIILNYSSRNTLLLHFSKDDDDVETIIEPFLDARKRFMRSHTIASVDTLKVNGTFVTPLTPDILFGFISEGSKTKSLSILSVIEDAIRPIAKYIRSEMLSDVDALVDNIANWLDSLPQSTSSI